MNGSCESTPDEAYLDRNLAVQVLARMAIQLGYKVGVRDRGKDWPILYVDLPTGQVSWHLPSSELIGNFPEYDVVWDGHNVEEKRGRLSKFVETLR
ncbi:MAG: hypothetical protein M1162_05265 [Candidatus Thermoplasmatota archaeon]|nr:hypothetical protein [Candidatus Thermoplasmatota archaeon]